MKLIEIKPVFITKIPEKEILEENKIYISKEYNTSIHLCFCGCKNEVINPLDASGWILTTNDGKVTLTPSINNYNFRCESHYIITKNVVHFIKVK